MFWWYIDSKKNRVRLDLLSRETHMNSSLTDHSVQAHPQENQMIYSFGIYTCTYDELFWWGIKNCWTQRTLLSFTMFTMLVDTHYQLWGVQLVTIGTLNFLIGQMKQCVLPKCHFGHQLDLTGSKLKLLDSMSPDMINHSCLSGGWIGTDSTPKAFCVMYCIHVVQPVMVSVEILFTIPTCIGAQFWMQFFDMVI